MLKFRTFLTLACLAGTACLAQAPALRAAAKATFQFTEVDYPGAAETFLFGENNRGLTTGAYYVQGQGTHAFVMANGAFRPLDPQGVLGQNESYALTCNDLGVVVGQYLNADASVSHGYTWHNGTVTTVDYPGSTYSAVYGINLFGTLIGVYNDAAGATQGYLMEHGNFTPLTGPGVTNITPLSINLRGDIVGQLNSTVDGLAHGFLRTREGEYTLLDAPGALAGTTVAISINDLWQILGYDSLADGSYHGFLKVRDVFEPIDYPGTDVTVTQTINDFQRIVGYFVDASGLSHGFVAVPGRR